METPFHATAEKLLSARTIATVLFSAAALFTSAQAASSRDLMLFADNATLPTIVKKGTEQAAAEQASNAQHGCFVVMGEGESMEPVYLAGTALVVRAGGYEQLRRGSAVVYASRRGYAVAHMVVEKTDAGWIVAGLNNDGTDSELVTPDNFVGVITQAFASRIGSLPKQVVARIAMNEQIRHSGKVASLTGAVVTTNGTL